MKKILGSLLAFFCLPSLAIAENSARTIVLEPQYRIVGQGHFCGVFNNGVVIHDVAAGQILLADSVDLNNRVVLTIPISSGSGLKVRKVLDLDGDGCSEIVVEDRFGASFDVMYLQGMRVMRLTKLPVRDFFASTLIESDFLSNGKHSLFVANKATGEIVSYVSDGLAWQSRTLNPAGHGDGLIPVSISDFNHDGFADVFWRNPFTQEFSFSKGSNSAILSAEKMDVAALAGLGSSSVPYLGQGDFNHDGRTEFVFYNPIGPPDGRIIVVGYDLHFGFVKDEGVERTLNEAFKNFVDKLGDGSNWKITVVNDPSGRYSSGFVLSTDYGLL